MTAAALTDALRPVLDLLATLDLRDAPAAAAALHAAFPPEGEVVAALHARCREGLAAGWLCDKSAGDARFSRVARASEATRGFTIDAVLSRGEGVEHTHPEGEVDLAFAEEGAPDFDGRPPGWIVYAPGTRHRPDVHNGAMLLLYFLPGGKIEWHRG